MMRLRCTLLCILLCTAPVLAEEVVFYRCTDASGALTLQNMACPKGSTQEKKVMRAVSTVPMGTAAPAPTTVAREPADADANADATPDAKAPAPVVIDAATDAATATTGASEADALRSEVARLPPPNLFQCTTYDKDTYISESPEPQARCVALRTVGLDGNPDTGAGQACEVVRDTCARVPDADLCAAWKKRLGETEVAWRFARPANAEANKAEHERVQRIVSETSCSTSG